MTLEELRWHWGEAYEITEALGVYRAVRRDNQRSLVSRNSEDLNHQMRRDYEARPVPRRAAASPSICGSAEDRAQVRWS